MSNDLPIPRQDLRSGDAVVVEWGGDRRDGGGRIGRLLGGLGRDHRLAPVVAGLGCVAAFASLIGEWTIMTVPNAGPDGNTPVRVPAGVSEVGNFGTAYLVGLFAVLSCLSLVLFGSAGVRRNARVVGLTLTGGLVGVLAAAAASLDEAAGRLFYFAPADGFHVDYGRGLVTAFAAVGLLGLALGAAGRPAAPATADDGTAGVDVPDPDFPGTTGGRSGWLRRRRTTTGPTAGDQRSPSDLTVTAAPPFVHPHRPTGG